MTYLEKRKKLPTHVLAVLSSDHPRWEGERICFMYGLKEENISSITGPIGLIFVGDIQLKDYPQIIVKDLNLSIQIAYGIAYEMNKRVFNKLPDYFKDSEQLLREWGKMKSPPVISEEEAYRKVIEIEPWILDAEKERRQLERAEEEAEKKHLASLVKLSLPQALKQYPKLENQQITNDLLKLHYSEFPSRPTIKNWITDYYQNLGVGNHGIMERGNFLFHSENCKKLGSVERQKLALVFKSLSENMPLVIDTERQQIVFPEISSEQKTIINREQEAISNAQRTASNNQRPVNSEPKSVDSNQATGNSRQKTASSDQGAVKFFSGQDMKPTPPVAESIQRTALDMESAAQNEERSASSMEQPSNAGNLHFSSHQKLPAESEKKDAGSSTLRIFPRGYRNGPENNSSANTQDVKISGNIVDLKNKN